MSMFAEILALGVSLKGVETVQHGLQSLVGDFKESEKAAAALQKGMASLAAVVGVVSAGLKEQIEQTHYQAMYEGLTGSARLAAESMEAVDRIASKGIFSEHEALTAVETMNRYGVSVAKNIDLVEKLGTRSGSLDSAAGLVSMIEEGYTQGLGRRLKQFGIGPNKLRDAGLTVEGTEIKGTSQEILRALEKIESSDKLIGHLQNTVQAGAARTRYQFMELIETIGEPFVKPVQKVLEVLTNVFKVIKDLNSATHGWLSAFAVAGVVVEAMIKMWGAMKLVYEYTKLSAIWGTIYGAISQWTGLATAIKLLAEVWEFLTTKQKLAVVWALIYDALTQNWAAIGAAAVIATAAGVAWFATDGFKGPAEDPKNQPSAGGKRPVRRDDWERMQERAMGDVWGT